MAVVLGLARLWYDNHEDRYGSSEISARLRRKEIHKKTELYATQQRKYKNGRILEISNWRCMGCNKILTFAS
jgi:hypothetical protein